MTGVQTCALPIYVRPLHITLRTVRERLRTITAHHAFDLARRYLTGLDYEAGMPQ